MTVETRNARGNRHRTLKYAKRERGSTSSEAAKVAREQWEESANDRRFSGAFGRAFEPQDARCVRDCQLNRNRFVRRCLLCDAGTGAERRALGAVSLPLRQPAQMRGDGEQARQGR